MDLKALFALINKKGLPYFEGNYSTYGLYLCFSELRNCKGNAIEITTFDNGLNDIVLWQRNPDKVGYKQVIKEQISSTEVLNIVRTF